MDTDDTVLVRLFNTTMLSSPWGVGGWGVLSNYCFNIYSLGIRAMIHPDLFGRATIDECGGGSATTVAQEMRSFETIIAENRQDSRTRAHTSS